MHDFDVAQAAGDMTPEQKLPQFAAAAEKTVQARNKTVYTQNMARYDLYLDSNLNYYYQQHALRSIWCLCSVMLYGCAVRGNHFVARSTHADELLWNQ